MKIWVKKKMKTEDDSGYVVGSVCLTQNDDGDWVRGVPEPYYRMIKKQCWECKETFWTKEAYRGHYALRHILKI